MAGGIFNPENGFYRVTEKLVDLVLLSVFWLFCCIPVVTIGPSTAALYDAVVRCLRRDERNSWAIFFRTFRANLKVGLLTTLVLLPMSRVLEEELPHLAARYAVLSGPSFAAEVMEGQPTAVVLGCRDERLGGSLRDLFSTPSFRCYSSTDVTGVEMGGALKNVMAIAAGVCTGLGFGSNASAALIRPGLRETPIP